MEKDYLNLQEVEQKIAETRRKHLEGEMTEGLRIMYLAQIRIDIQTLWKKEEIPPKKAEELWDRARAVLDEKPSNVNSREEEVKRRIQEWEQKNNKNLKDCSR